MILLLCKTANPQRSIVQRIAFFDIAIACFRPRLRDAKNDHVLSGSGKLDGVLQHPEKCCLICDHMVRRENSQHRIGICFLDEECSQSCSRRSIAGCRLAYNLLRWHHIIELAANRRRKKIVSDDPEIISFCERSQAVYRSLNHRALAIQGQHLLRTRLAATWPE